MRTLTEIAATVDTDKGPHATSDQQRLYGSTQGHCYTDTYESMFAEWRDRPMTLLELGVGNGGSLCLWAEAFPLGEIHGLDKDTSRLGWLILRTKSIVPWRGDATDRALAARIQAHRPSGFDIIIDDASHVPADQTGSLALYWPQVRSGGWYIIEDVRSGRLDKSLLGLNAITSRHARLILSQLVDVCAVGFRK